MFSRKRKLREEYDQKLIDLMSKARKDWANQKSLIDICFEYNEELNYHRMTTEAKYFFLFREAKKRNLRIKI